MLFPVKITLSCKFLNINTQGPFFYAIIWKYEEITCCFHVKNTFLVNFGTVSQKGFFPFLGVLHLGLKRKKSSYSEKRKKKSF